MPRKPERTELAPPTRALREMSNASRELLARSARSAGMNATDMTALDLLDLHGAMGAAELAARLGIRSASATVLVDRLERAGLVGRVPHATDRRRVVIEVRPDARAASLAAWLPAIAAIDEVGRELSAEEQRVVVDYLARVTRAMSGYPTSGRVSG